MYIIDAYNTTDRNKIVEFIENNNFGDLVSFNNGALCSNKVPFFYDRFKNELYGHFGRSNSQLRDIQQENEVLVIFTGAHAYISPQWYESKNMVPTWNYQTIQARGIASLVDDDTLIDILNKLTAFHESRMPEQWSMNLLDADRLEKMLTMITGFKIEITDIKFKEKMSQIRADNDQNSVINALNKQYNQASKDVANIMLNNIKNTSRNT